MNSSPPRLIGVSDTADILGVSTSYLNKARLTGAGPPFVKIGSRVRYDPGDLVDWIEQQKRRSTSDGPG